MIPGVTEKDSVTTLKFTSVVNQTSFFEIIKKNFAEYRRYPRISEINAGADYSFERAMYVGVLEQKVDCKLRTPHLPVTQEYIGVLRDFVPGIEKFQEGSSLQIKETKAYQLIASLEKLLSQVNPRMDVVAQLANIPHIDYLMVILIRKIIKSLGALTSSTQLQLSAIDKIPCTKDTLRSISGAFRLIINVYELRPDYKEPAMQHAVFFGLAQGSFFTFYTYSTKPQIKLKEERTIQLQSAVEHKRNMEQGQSSISTSKSMIHRASTIAQSTLVINERCDLCSREAPESECLNSNFKRFCKACIFNPQVDLSMIPEPLIRKFVKEHQLNTMLQMICPNCEQVLCVNDYSPVRKPSFVRCSKCNSQICVKHNLISFLCFCVCKRCNIPTYNDRRLQLKICLKCKDKYCQNCKDRKCSCRCPRCLELERELDKHKCELDRVCHDCLNSFANMVKCSCGGLLCRTCALPRIETIDCKLCYRCPYK